MSTNKTLFPSKQKLPLWSLALASVLVAGCGAGTNTDATGGAATGGAQAGGTGGAVDTVGGAGGGRDGESCTAPYTVEEFEDPTLCETAGYGMVLRVPTGVDCVGRAYTVTIGSHAYQRSIFDEQGRLTSDHFGSSYEGISDHCSTGLPEPIDSDACSAQLCLVCRPLPPPPWDDPPEEPFCDP